MKSILVRLLRDTSGQDLIEYALLTGAIGFAGLLAFEVIKNAMCNTYNGWERTSTASGNPPDPGAGS